MSASAVTTDAARIVVLCGTGPIGRAALRSWPARVSDGYLYAQLRGSGPAEPTPPQDVLVTFLYALGVTAERVPVGLHARMDLYRLLTSNRRLLVVLDDAVCAAQVRPLLPLAGTAVVTSRWHLAGLRADGATLLTPERPGPDDLLALVTHELGAQP